MLNEELIDVVNQGNSWALVGSGPSCMAGAPSWPELALAARAGCKTPTTKGFNELHFKEFVDSGAYPAAFNYLELHFGRESIESTVKGLFGGLTTPSAFHKEIARWPFAGYITTNYDLLLEVSLAEGAFGSWTAVGNTVPENKLIQQDVSDIVWHPHGIAAAGNVQSRLIVSGNDYDDVYAVGSLTVHALDALLRLKRIVILGFGFNDTDLLHVLERIKRVTTPAKPAFAFVANCLTQAEWRDKYNVEVISYKSSGSDHSNVLNDLDVYRSFIPTRDVRFSVPVATHPEFNEQVTSLITHNRLIQHKVTIADDALAGLLTASVLHAMSSSSPLDETGLRARLSHCGKEALGLLTRVLADLCQGDVLRFSSGQYEVSEKGQEFLDGAKAHSSLLFEQFRAQVKQRVVLHAAGSTVVDIENVSTVCANYFQSLGRKCGLGIAQQLCHGDQAQADARGVSLLHELHVHFEHCKNRTEADILVKTARDILGSATRAEEEYLGLLSQSYFGRHLLNADPASLAVRQEELSKTVFQLDASFIIQLLAVSSPRHQLAQALYKRLQDIRCRLFTTHDLLEEVAEHARWAYALLKRHGPQSREVVEAASGHRRTANRFLESYLLDPRYGPQVHYQIFFNSIVNANGTSPDSRNLEPLLETYGIDTVELDQIEGFKEEHILERDRMVTEITDRRHQRKTFRHDRQVLAEANVVIIIKMLRNSTFALDGIYWPSVLFITHSRVLDDLPGIPSFICISPASLFNWLLTVRAVEPEDAIALFEEILRTMSLAGAEIIPRRQLIRVFAGVTDASRSRVEELKSEQRELMHERYALDPDEAFKDVNPLAWPTIENSVEKDMVAALQDRLVRKESETAALQQKVAKSEKEKKYYERLKAKDEARKRRNKKKARREKSKPKKGKKRRGK